MKNFISLRQEEWEVTLERFDVSEKAYDQLTAEMETLQQQIVATQ